MAMAFAITFAKFTYQMNPLNSQRAVRFIFNLHNPHNSPQFRFPTSVPSLPNTTNPPSLHNTIHPPSPSTSFKMPKPAFLPPLPPLRPTLNQPPNLSSLTSLRPHRTPRPAKLQMAATTPETESLNLPPTLHSYVTGLSTVPDPKLRYQQLLFLARKLPPMPSSLKTDANLVRGCTSIVHVHVDLDSAGNVHLQGDSDAQLTKGLLALLVNGLDGVSPQQVFNVDPAFIRISGLAVSLTPSRNNGFVNMLAKIKATVRELVERREGGEETESVSVVGEVPGRPVYSAILRKLAALKPVRMEVTDQSAMHAGHAGAKGLDGESHFAVDIVAEVFGPLDLVQRHRLIYTVLTEEMGGGIHALAIDAKTPQEAGL